MDLVKRSNANVPIDLFHKQIFNKIFIINLIGKMEYFEFTVDYIYMSLWIFCEYTVIIFRKNMIIFARLWYFFFFNCQSRALDIFLEAKVCFIIIKRAFWSLIRMGDTCVKWNRFIISIKRSNHSDRFFFIH